VRETWCPLDAPDHFTDPAKPKDALIHGRRNGAAYRADMKDAESERCRLELGYKWRPSIYMPRWASRITLIITNVRVQRVQEITRDDALAEGVDLSRELFPTMNAPDKALRLFPRLWDSINAKRGFGWDTNPWVWAITFQRV
jgi:hypothetical protein